MQHPDEGTIHAWLDGALPAGEARAVEEHLAGCSACAAAAAEARGLMAASSRILSALDSVPGGVLPAAEPVAPAATGVVPIRGRASRWRSGRWRAAAAIVLVGSVSWLATRSTQPSTGLPAAVPDAAAMARVEMAPVNEPAAAAPGAATSARPRVTRPPAPASPVAVAAQAGAAADVRPSPPPAPSPMRKAIANTAIVRPNVAAEVEMQSAKTAATTSAPMTDLAGSAAGAVARGSASIADQAMRERRLTPAPSMMQRPPSAMTASAPESGFLPGTETVQRLAGCYTLAISEWAPAAAQPEVAMTLLPMRVELVDERSPGGGSSEMLLRPAPGQPAFPAGFRAYWKPASPELFELRITDGLHLVGVVMLGGGDRFKGQARAYSDRVIGGRTASVSATKAPCTPPKT